MGKHNKLYDVALMRSFAIIVAVFFHCYQMMWATHFPLTMDMYKNLYFSLVQCGIINVAMPLFVFISGYLFVYLLKKGKYHTWTNLLYKKGFRILGPYFVFGLFFISTTGDWHPLRLLCGNYWHLWFLPMLFWCFVLGYGVYNLKLKENIEAILLVVIFFLSIAPMLLPVWLGINYISHWFFWFYLGMFVYKSKNRLFGFINRYRVSWLLLFLYLIVNIFYPTEYGDNTTWFCVLSTTGCIIGISYLMDRVDWSRIKVAAPFSKFSTYSFGIYIWHNWVALMLISKTSQRIFDLPELAANHVILFPLCFSLITLVISWGLSWGMMKTKVGSFLIG